MLLHTISFLKLLLHCKQTVSCTLADPAWRPYLRVIAIEFASGAPYLPREYMALPIGTN